MTVDSWEETLVRPKKPLLRRLDVRIPRTMSQNTLTPWAVSGQAAADPSPTAMPRLLRLESHSPLERNETHRMSYGPV